MNHNKISAEPGKSRAPGSRRILCRAPSHKSMSFHVKQPGSEGCPVRDRLPVTGGFCRITEHGPSTQQLCEFQPPFARGSHRRIADAGGSGPQVWGLPRLGLSHFDEGIYAIAGLWSVSPRGLTSLDPTLIPYAPPGFPILVGVAYLGLGVSDLAAILVSILAGTLTIPAAAWLARRTSGAGAGAAAAGTGGVFGLSCRLLPHGAHRRLVSALLDSGTGLRPAFSGTARALPRDRPGTERGPAQWFKYNGWLLGVFVILAVCLGILVDPSHRPRIRAIWGYGLLAVLVAGAVYWPWFTFVESHGGYAGLLRHHQSYMGGFSSWLPHLRLQLEQMAALSGGPAWNITEYLAAVLCCKLVLLALGKPNHIEPRSCLRSSLSLFPFSTGGSASYGLSIRGSGGAQASGCWRRPGLGCRS